uniref:GG11169 n=1 Tax=Drosophila erecta TaxID=7220 RepID=B3P8I4_DROER
MKIISRSIRSGALAPPTAATATAPASGSRIRKSSQRRHRAPLQMNCPILIVISLGWLLHAHAGSGGFAVEAAISNREIDSTPPYSALAGGGPVDPVV